MSNSDENPKSVRSAMNEGSENNREQHDDRNCIVCCKEAKIFSIGACDHPVCFECSTRMRVLCSKNECPICRKELKKVVFIRKLASYDKEFKHKRFHIFDRQFGIGFEDEGIYDLFDRLLQYRCPMCDSQRKRASFPSFHMLRRHVQKAHDRFFCDLCVDNLRIFNHERKCYTREELTEHRRKGDADDKSHRGHPLCKFCDQRFLDNDDLYRHVRRDHFFCHFCDADEAAAGSGKNVVFSDYNFLREHFLKDHFLCEDGRCKEERFVNAFRTELDLKAHKMKEHMGAASKAVAKQTRTLELEFSVARRGGDFRGGPRDQRDGDFRSGPRDVGDFRGGSRDSDFRGGSRDDGGGRNSRDQRDRRDREGDGESEGSRGQGRGRRRMGPRNVEEEEARFRADFEAMGAFGSGGGPKQPETTEFSVDSSNVADFPSLAVATGASGSSANASGVGPTAITIRPGSKKQQHPQEVSYLGRAARNMMREEDFPSLSSTVKPSSGQSGVTKSAGNSGGTSVTINISRQGTGEGQKPSRSGVSVEYHRSVTVPLAASSNAASFNAPPSEVPSSSGQTGGPTAAKARVTRISSSQNIRVESPVGVDHPPVVVSQANVPTLESIGESIGGWGGAKPKKTASAVPGAGVAFTSKRAVANGGDAFPTLGPPEKVLPSHSFAAASSNSKGQSNGGSGSVWGAKSKQRDQPQPNSSQAAQQDSKKSTGSLVLSKSNPHALDNVPPGFSSVKSIDSDFPALQPSKPSSASSKRVLPPPPGFKAAVVGGGKGKNSATSSTATELTFTSSSGQKFDMNPPSNNWVYAKPRNFENRSEELTRRIKEDALGGDIDALDSFSSLSASYLSEGLPAGPYFNRCRSTFGDKFDEIFPEFLALLPNLTKQVELFEAYTDDAANDRRRRMGDRKGEDLFSCPLCKQVVLARDYEDHADYHGQLESYPALKR